MKVGDDYRTQLARNLGGICDAQEAWDALKGSRVGAELLDRPARPAHADDPRVAEEGAHAVVTALAQDPVEHSPLGDPDPATQRLLEVKLLRVARHFCDGRPHDGAPMRARSRSWSSPRRGATVRRQTLTAGWPTTAARATARSAVAVRFRTEKTRWVSPSSGSMSAAGQVAVRAIQGR